MLPLAHPPRGSLLTLTARRVSRRGQPVLEPFLGTAIDLRQIQLTDDCGERTFVRMAVWDARGSVVFLERRDDEHRRPGDSGRVES